MKYVVEKIFIENPIHDSLNPTISFLQYNLNSVKFIQYIFQLSEILFY